MERSGGPREWLRGLLSVSGLLLAVVASLLQGRALWSFYVETAEMPRGTGIRPMGLVMVLFIVGYGTWLFGSVLSCAGFVASLRTKSWLLATVAILGLILSLAQPILGRQAFNYIVELRGLVCEP